MVLVVVEAGAGVVALLTVPMETGRGAIRVRGRLPLVVGLLIWGVCPTLPPLCCNSVRISQENSMSDKVTVKILNHVFSIQHSAMIHFVSWNIIYIQNLKIIKYPDKSTKMSGKNRLKTQEMLKRRASQK